MHINKMTYSWAIFLFTLNACASHKPTAAPKNISKNSGASSKSPTSKPLPTTSSGSTVSLPNSAPAAPAEQVLKSQTINDEDFVKISTLSDVVFKTGSIPFMEPTTGRILIPTCPSKNPNCPIPTLNVFDPTALDVSTVIAPQTSFNAHSIDYNGQIIGTGPGANGQGTALSKLDKDLSTLMTPPQDNSIYDPAEEQPITGPFTANANVVAGPTITPNGRPIGCSPFDLSCYVPDSSKCAAVAPSLKSIKFDTGYDAFCLSYLDTSKIEGYTSNNELIISDAKSSPGKIIFSFYNLSKPTAAPSNIEVLGDAGAGNPYSFFDYTHQYLFAFTSLNSTRSWTVIQIDNKSIVGHLPLTFTMEDRGSYFMDVQGNVIEIRNATSTNPLSIYLLSSEQLFDIVNPAGL